MKTKFVTYGLLALLISCPVALTSCSIDDNPTLDPPIPVESRYLAKVSDENRERVLRIEYNQDKRIKKFAFLLWQFGDAEFQP